MSHKVSSCEVLVAGGGIIGAACARAAALAGLRVAICEPGPEPAAASAASAGILGAQIERTDESLRALGLRGRDLYESLAASLLETTGIDIGLWREGIASLAFDVPEAERLRDAISHQSSRFAGKCRRCGGPPACRAQSCTTITDMWSRETARR